MKVINKSDWEATVDGEAFYVGRGTPLGNPWTHLKGKTKARYVVESRAQSILKYKEWLPQQLLEGNPQVCNEFNKILIKHLKKEPATLICHCKPKDCHADFIAYLVEKSRWVRNWFSNMIPMDEPYVYQGMEFAAVENFYQAMKLEKHATKSRKLIAEMSPQASKKKIRTLPLRADWDKNLAKKVMEHGLRIKFAPGTSWREKLDSTKGEEIVEWNNWNDTYWGRCIFTHDGSNHLGKLLMKIRDEGY